ncbi:MAG: family 16 glycosylhydrolase, partial [Anaerolineales bacterium]
LVGLVFPFRKIQTRRYLSEVIVEDSFSLSVDTTQWHSYQLEWSPKRVVWKVDDVEVFESSVSPNPPLGLVIWIDNQFASFTPDGKLSFGVLENDEAWLEIADLQIKKPAAHEGDGSA